MAGELGTNKRADRGLAPIWTYRGRYLIVTGVALAAAYSNRSILDWTFLSGSGAAIFGPDGLHIYARVPSLQAGPLSLIAIHAIDVLSGRRGLISAHIIMALVLPLVLLAGERLSSVPFEVRSISYGSRLNASYAVAFAAMLCGWSIQGGEMSPDAAAVALGSCCLLAVVLESVRRRRGLEIDASAPRRVLMLGLIAAPVWADLAGATGHLDDALAFGCGAWALVAASRKRPVTTGLLVGLAIAFKPWAIVALPVLTAHVSGRRNAWLCALLLPIGSWLPFLLADRGTLAATGQHFVISHWAPISLAGLHGVAPSWLRATQLAGCLVAAFVVAHRRGWVLAFSAGITARLLLDPATFPYYAATVVLAVIMADLILNWQPWRTAVAIAALWLWPLLMFQLHYQGGSAIALGRTVGLLVLLVSYLCGRPVCLSGSGRAVESPAKREPDREPMFVI